MQDFSLPQALIEGEHFIKTMHVNSVTKCTLSSQREIISAIHHSTPCSFLHIKILLLARAMEELEAEKAAREEAKVHYLGEKLPPLQLTGLTLDDLQVSHKNCGGKVNVKHSIQ